MKLKQCYSKGIEMTKKFQTTTEFLLYTILKLVEEDLKCQCGEPPFDNSNLCPKCTIGWSLEAIDKIMEKRDMNVGQLNN